MNQIPNLFSQLEPTTPDVPNAPVSMQQLKSAAFMPRRSTLSPSQRKIVADVRRRYPTIRDFLLGVSPTWQRWCMLHPERALCLESSPTLRLLQDAYGGEAARAWLVAQITELLVYCKGSGAFSENVISQLADVISANYGFLRCSEVMLFLGWFKAGRYGHAYGALDPLRVTSTMASFCRERLQLLRRYEAERERRERLARQEADQSRCVTYEEYLAMKQRGEC